jgi:hypothetical protein
VLRPWHLGYGLRIAAEGFDQADNLGVEAFVGQAQGLALGEVRDRHRQRGCDRHGRLADQHWNNPLARAQRRRDFEAHIVVRQVEAAPAMLVSGGQPFLVDQSE